MLNLLVLEMCVKPLMPLCNMRHRVLISPADSKLIEGLSEHNIHSYYTQRLDDVPLMERYHADMQVLRIDDTAFVAECFCNVYKNYFPAYVNVIPVKSPTGRYPDNVSLNAAYSGGRLFCKESSLDDKVKSFCCKKGIEITNVNQGYAKCSTLVLGNKGIITADAGIADAARKQGVDALKITPGFINLEGSDYGFIGGASGVIGETVIFFGNINLHPDKKDVLFFIKNKGYNYICVGDEPLNDVGGLILLD